MGISGGGAGAGKVVAGTFTASSGTPYNVSVGGGGAISPGNSPVPAPGSDGSSSGIPALTTAAGGGKGFSGYYLDPLGAPGKGGFFYGHGMKAALWCADGHRRFQVTGPDGERFQCP